MNRLASALSVSCLFASLVVTGCSSSEQASKDQPPVKTAEFKRVDKDEEVTPIVETPKETADVPTTEKNVPAPTPEPAKAVPEETAPAQQAAVQKSGNMMWSVQIGAFKMESGAIALINEAKAKFKQPMYKDFDPVTSFYKVTVGSFQTRDQAAQFKTEVQSKGYPDAFTVEVRR